MIVHCLYDKLIDIKKLKPHPKNRNDHPKDQVERLAGILKYQGWRYPVKVSKRSGFITSGHGRLQAAILNGWKQVPVNYQDYETDDQEYADLIADNSIASWAELDLAAINIDVPDLGPDFDIDLLGIKDFVIESADKYADKDADEVPEARKTTIQLGDLFQLGSHRLLCGDSTDKVSVERLMNGEKADMVYTDPPYNVDYGSNTTNKIRKIQNDSMDSEDWHEFVSSYLKNILSFCDGNIFIAMSDKELGHLQQTFIALGGHWSSFIVWVKSSMVLGMKDYHSRHETMLYGWREGVEARVRVKDRSMTDVWEVKKPSNSELHPTMKPVELIEIALINSSHTTDKILDLFLGSGSTLIACEKTNRKCFGMEIDPQYCQVILDRWEKFTGQKAVKLD